LLKYFGRKEDQFQKRVQDDDRIRVYTSAISDVSTISIVLDVSAV